MTMWDDIPDVGVLVPAGTYLVNIEDIEKGQSREHSKLMYSPVLRIVEPDSHADSPLYDNFVIGSDKDPGATLEDTWKASFGARRFKQLAKATQVELDSYVDAAQTPEDQADQTVEVIKGQQVVVSVSIEKQPDKNQDGTPNRFAGREQNRITGYYPQGMRQLGVAEQPQAAASRPMPRPTAPKPAAPVAPMRRLGPQPGPQPVVPPAPRPTAPARSGLRPGPKPMAKAAPAPPPPPPTRPGRPAKPQMMECAECVKDGGDKTQTYNPDAEYPNGALVSRADFPAHVEGHGEE